MNIRKPVVNNICAALEKLVDDPSDAFFVAGNCRGGDNDCVAFADYQLVICVCHAEKPAHGFSLAARGKNADTVVLVVLELFKLHNAVLRQFEISEILCDLRYHNH